MNEIKHVRCFANNPLGGLVIALAPAIYQIIGPFSSRPDEREYAHDYWQRMEDLFKINLSSLSRVERDSSPSQLYSDFQVRCNAETNTPELIDQGRVRVSLAMKFLNGVDEYWVANPIFGLRQDPQTGRTHLEIEWT